MNTVTKLARRKLRFRSNAPMLELPFYGNLCLPVHRGYKVFNFHRKTVIKILNTELDQATVESEIHGVRKAAILDFAPNVVRWNVKERWYEEDFVSGYPCYDTRKSESAVFLKIYYSEIAACLEQMILLQSPLVTTLTEHMNKTLSLLEDRRWSDLGLDMRKLDSVRYFVESIVMRLRREGDMRIDLLFSHGDFSLVNILRTNDGIKVIDWEGAGFRSVLFDLYNYFFTELYYRRATSNLIPDIDKAICFLQSRLMAQAPDLAATLVPLAQMYRKLYYLERTHMLLERELNNKVLDVILRSKEVFNWFEKEITIH